MNNDELNNEWNNIINELDELMDKVSGKYSRIQGCTLKEEWRIDNGWSPFDADIDSDTWKDSYDMFDEAWGPEEDDLEYYRGIMDRCGLTQEVLELKYPRVAAHFKRYEK